MATLPIWGGLASVVVFPVCVMPGQRLIFVNREIELAALAFAGETLAGLVPTEFDFRHVQVPLGKVHLIVGQTPQRKARI